MNKAKVFKAWADGVRAELQVCADDLAKGMISRQNKDGFNIAVNCLSSAYGYCLTGAALAEHPLLSISKPSRFVVAGITRGLQHVKMRTAHSAAGYLALRMDPSTEPAEGMDYWEILQDKKEPCSMSDVISRIEQAVEEAVSEKTKEAAVDALKGLLDSLED